MDFVLDSLRADGGCFVYLRREDGADHAAIRLAEDDGPRGCLRGFADAEHAHDAERGDYDELRDSVRFEHALTRFVDGVLDE